MQAVQVVEHPLASIHGSTRLFEEIRQVFLHPHAAYT